MSFLFFIMGCGIHTTPQKVSIQNTSLESATPDTVQVQTGLHNGVFTGYNPQAVLGEMKQSCARCRRRPSVIEQSFIDRCKQAGGEFITCGCIEILCSVQLKTQ